MKAIAACSGRAKVAVAASLFLLAGCSVVERSAPPSQAADFLLWDGAVYTVNEAQPWAEAVAVKDGRIQFVGSSEQARTYVGAATVVIDLDDQMVMPGFIDTHAHLVLAAGSSHAVILERDGTPEAWLEAVASSAGDNPERPYVLGFGFLAATFGPSGPTKELLDSVVSDRPVVLIDEGGHTAWVNSRALELAGIDKSFPDPVPGVHYFKRDPEGNPTGWCLEAMTFNPLILKLGLTSAETVIEGANELFWLASSFGITTVFDAGMSVFEDVAGQPGNNGAILLEGEPLQDFVSAIDQAGFDVHIHAIGDRAVDEALDAFEAARRTNPSSSARYSIAHVELVRDVDLPRFAALGVSVQTTPFWFASDLGYETEALGTERANRLYRFDEIERSGGRIAFGSDFPATGDVVGLFPILNVEMGMTRKFVDRPEMRTTPPAQAVLSLQTMLKGYTLNAAYQLNLERELGSLEVGKRADLIILTGNLFEMDTHDIHEVRVDLTMMNGEVVYERGLQTLLAEWMLGM